MHAYGLSELLLGAEEVAICDNTSILRHMIVLLAVAEPAVAATLSSRTASSLHFGHAQSDRLISTSGIGSDHRVTSGGLVQ